MDSNKIPLIIGVTGHLNLRAEDLDVLRDTVKQELAKILNRCPHTPLILLCSLAKGADLLCAEAAEELGIPLRAVLPMEQAEYEKDFPPEDLARLRRQTERAETVFTAPAAEEEPEGENRDFRYRQAGIYMAEHSHLLLALWDGKGENASHCGTAAAVLAALDGDWQPRRGIACRNAENIAVLHIMTPRENETCREAGTVTLLGNREALEEALARTEEFNRLAETDDGSGYSLLPEDKPDEPGLQKLEALYRTADNLSMRFGRLYRQKLSLLAILGTVVTFAFLMYDEMDMLPMILVCAAAVIGAILTAGSARRFATHRRYIEYRTLAETLRVQMFLRYAGSSAETQRLMPWTQQKEIPWILCAMGAVNAEKPPEQAREIRDCWAEDQRQYHEKAEKRTSGQLGRNNRLLQTAAVCAVILYFGGLAFELLGGGLLFRPVIAVQNPPAWRTILKILLGTVSAGTLFLASYYGKMSLERKNADHGKMKVFYGRMGRELERRGQTEELLETLAREELTENGNWCSYQRDNAPELNL